MREPTIDAELAFAALRYAAGDLPAAAAVAFETTLGESQPAREALAEAVRLSAAAAGVPLPEPDPLFKQAVVERVRPTWLTRLFPRRPYRGHPALWASVGGSLAVAVVVMVVGATAPDDRQQVVYAGPPVLFERSVTVREGGPIPTEGRSEPTAARQTAPAATPTSHPRLNPMGMEPKGGAATASTDPTPAPMVTPVAPTVVPTAVPAKPMGGTVAEGPDAPLPAADPHIGML